MVCCSWESSASRSEIFCSASELACVQSRRLFLKDCTCLFKLAVVDACLFFLAFGSYFKEIASRLWMARSISMIICSWRRLSCSSLSSILWISFFMAAESAWPTFGSSASCISFSRVILRSHNRTWRSASKISLDMSPFSSRTRPMFVSMLRHLASISFNFCTNSISIIWFEFWSSADFASCFTTLLFMRSMSKRRCFMELSSSLISFRWDSSWPSILTFFCSSTIFLFLWSFTLLFIRSVSWEMVSSCVCFWIQSFCMSAHSLVRSVIVFFMCFSLASCGPDTSASPASASNFVLFSSYSLLRRSTYNCFFSI
mmetsp:Transcript_80926/g.203596  ORF Transcript_80926/g.203596 Transcript_80926/m.203596 type:complete len:314 (+) Transcript_80926:430-1371(+)